MTVTTWITLITYSLTTITSVHPVSLSYKYTHTHIAAAHIQNAHTNTHTYICVITHRNPKKYSIFSLDTQSYLPSKNSLNIVSLVTITRVLRFVILRSIR